MKWPSALLVIVGLIGEPKDSMKWGKSRTFVRCGCLMQVISVRQMFLFPYLITFVKLIYFLYITLLVMLSVCSPSLTSSPCYFCFGMASLIKKHLWDFWQNFFWDYVWIVITKKSVYLLTQIRNCIATLFSFGWEGLMHIAFVCFTSSELLLGKILNKSVTFLFSNLPHLYICFYLEKRFPSKLLLCFLAEFFGCLGKEELSTGAWACEG